MSKFQSLAGLLGFLGVALGAFGAHGLKDRLVETGHLENWQTATLYLFVHALALLILSMGSSQRPDRKLKWVGWFWVSGTLIFSGSLYLLSLTNISMLGAITPIGGVCFLLGWGMLIAAGFRKTPSTGESA
ncbi:MAG: DUF423 domain-containing protein [Verrucomicrobia bacterium]|nr:DUF423 domain-containing protein [Verrucomicrobiota bacterium]